MKIELDRNDRISEVISAFLMVIHVVLLILVLPTLPETSKHFNEATILNGFKTKSGFWGFLALTFVLYAFMTFVSFKPKLYKFRMTKNNIEEQYRLTSKMARNLKPFILLAFLAVTVFMVQSVRGLWFDAQPFLFLIVFGLVISPCLYYAAKISKVQ